MKRTVIATLMALAVLVACGSPTEPPFAATCVEFGPPETVWEKYTTGDGLFDWGIKQKTVRPCLRWNCQEWGRVRDANSGTCV
jgi:hypothetical protein